MQGLSKLQVGKLARVVFAGIADAGTQDVLVEAQLLVGLGREHHRLVHVGKCGCVIAIIEMLVGTGKQRVVVVGVFGNLLVIDFHHGIGDLVPQHRIAALTEQRERESGGNERQHDVDESLVH